MRGTISLPVAIVTGVATVVVGILGAWGATNTRVGSVETEVQVLQTRQDLQYREVKEDLGIVIKEIRDINSKL